LSIFTLKSTIRVTCPKFVDPYLRQEIEALGYEVTRATYSGVEIEGTLIDCMKLNLWVRCGHKVLFMLDEFEASTEKELYDHLVEIPWEEYIPVNGHFSIESNIKNDSINNTQFASVRVKDAIADRFMSKMERRPNSGVEKSQSVIFVNWIDEQVGVFIDTSGETIAKHGYRKNPYKAPLQETLAAALIYAAQYSPDEQHFVNPMCGSGTLAIEAALIAKNMAPGLNRKNFGFMHIIGYVHDDWYNLKEEAKQLLKGDPLHKIIATDISDDAIRISKANAKEAGIDHLIDFKVCPFEQTYIPEGEGIVIINPEYGVRLGEIRDLEYIYKEIGDFFKQKCAGYKGFVFAGNKDLIKEIGLKTFLKRDFFSGKLECKFLGYKLFKGSKKDLYAGEGLDGPAIN